MTIGWSAAPPNGTFFFELERLANFGDDFAEQAHAECNTHRDNEHRPQVVDDCACLFQQGSEIEGKTHRVRLLSLWISIGFPAR